MNIDEAIELLNSIVKVNRHFLQGIENQTINQSEIQAIETLINEYNNLKQIEEAHRIENGKLRERIKQEKEKNKELFEEYNKRVNTIIKYEQGIKEFIDETHITDIEPWSIYKINGGLLFNLEQLLEEK